MDCWDHLIFYALPLAMVIDKLHQIMPCLVVKMNIINWLGTWIENDALRSSSREEVNLQNQRSNHGFNQLLFIIHKNLLLPRQKTMACRWRPKSKRALREHRQKKKKKKWTQNPYMEKLKMAIIIQILHLWRALTTESVKATRIMILSAAGPISFHYFLLLFFHLYSKIMLFSGAKPTQALSMFSSIARCFDSAFTTGVPGGTCFFHQTILCRSVI